MMIDRQLSLASVLLVSACTLAGCASNALPVSNALPLLQQNRVSAPQTTRSGKTRVAFRIFIPRRRQLDAASMRPFFVANSTRGISVTVYAHGSSTPASTANAAVAAGSPACKAVTGGRQCTVTAAAPAGNDDFTMKTYDAAPANGGFSGAKPLAVGTASKTIVAGKANSLNVTVGGIVAKASVHLGWPANPVIDKDVQTVTVSALDADGNTVINNGWYSANGAAVTMALSASNGNAGTFTFAPAKVTFASPTSKLTYDSTKTSPTQVQNGFNSSVAATPSNGATIGTAAFALTKPAFTEWSIATSTAYPEGITVGPDNAIWFTENVANAIARITTNAAAGSHPAEYSSEMTSSASPIGIAVAPDDHKLWFTEFGINKVASIDPVSHAITEYGSGLKQPYGITPGPDGNMWFAENCATHSYIGKFNANALDGSVGTIQEYATKTSNGSPSWIAPGPDGNLWFMEPGVDSVGTIATNGTGANEFATGMNTVGEGQIAFGPDNALWFTEENPNAGHRVGRITTVGSITIPHAFPDAGNFTSPYGIATGPDGSLWFTENGANKIGRIDASTHALTEFTIPTSNSNPWGIVKGPDGALWFTECLGNKIGKLQ